MLMREWRRGSGLPRWWSERRTVRLLRGLGIVCAAYAMAVTPVLLAEDEKKPSAPWLPTNGGQAGFLLVMAAVFVVAGGLGVILGLRDRKKRTGQPIFRSPPWPSPRSSYQLGVKWTVTGWRVWTFGVLLYAPCVPWIWLNFTKEEGEPIWGGLPFWNEASLVDIWMMLHAIFFSSYCFVLKGREVRRGKEQIRVADEYLAIREMRLHAEVDAMCEKFLQQQQEWKAQKTAELYEQILDQQARGLLPCPNCDEHRKSA
ncbi:hypothetical protein AQJ67_41475 [Streptomyces caeruleatus]|uniref:Uncharacterized protein n=1 Tax=Streptomyces caeruleatus TaxID=661399 RepID=A0A124I639_9ACTN|nr:hypothetical protein AQJ67_41475 [Streptomyces caeruleatus]